MESKPLISIDYDGVLKISVGSSRRDTRWVSRELKWSELLERLKNTTCTLEDFEEYKRLPKSRQDDIKDVGGFVGGVLKGGRRRNENLESRYLITLDADFAGMGLWERIKEGFQYCYCMYSTHKHCPEKPRYRILIPLLREVSPDEYQAVSRKLASHLGMEMFDDTTHEPARLMYWPSTSRDGVYEFHYQDRRWVNPDVVLDEYQNWRDTSTWPQAPGYRENILRTVKKESPGDKKGIQGAFCRTYSVPRAIEKYLSDVYLPCTDGTRYTYANGSTSGGLVIYEEGDFAYSFHGTDRQEEGSAVHLTLSGYINWAILMKQQGREPLGQGCLQSGPWKTLQQRMKGSG